MPIYEYHCLKCGATFEKLVSLNTESMDCEKCGSARVEKLFSAFAVQGGNAESFEAPAGGCGTCGAPRPGMCREMN